MGVPPPAGENRAKAVIAGEKAARAPRFVTVKNGSRSLDTASLARARRLAGLKGYVTNIPATLMPPAEVIASYHDLWHVEASFRMSKTDLRARPVFHHTRDAIEAHLNLLCLSSWRRWGRGRGGGVLGGVQCSEDLACEVSLEDASDLTLGESFR